MLEHKREIVKEELARMMADTADHKYVCIHEFTARTLDITDLLVEFGATPAAHTLNRGRGAAPMIQRFYEIKVENLKMALQGIVDPAEDISETPVEQELPDYLKEDGGEA